VSHAKAINKSSIVELFAFTIEDFDAGRQGRAIPRGPKRAILIVEEFCDQLFSKIKASTRLSVYCQNITPLHLHVVVDCVHIIEVLEPFNKGDV
jgi:hypothetical protein